MSGLKEIWNTGKQEDLPPHKLQAYLEGGLSDEERREVEVSLSEPSLASDAIEGLSALTPSEAQQTAGAVNRSLHQLLQQRKKRRRSKPVSSFWGWIAVLLILAIVVAAFVLIRMSQAQT